jgi:hypothetical protein
MGYFGTFVLIVARIRTNKVVSGIDVWLVCHYPLESPLGHKICYFFFVTATCTICNYQLVSSSLSLLFSITIRANSVCAIYYGNATYLR